MHEAHLRGIDLNLLVLLDALLKQGGVTRAALAVNLSQPAMSRALGRLRALLDDPLIVRGGDGPRLTPRGEALAAPVRDVLQRAGALLASPDFVAERWAGRVVLAATDHQSIVLLPDLIARLRVAAPLLDVEVRPLTAASMHALRSGEVQLGFGVTAGLPAGLNHAELYRDRFVTLFRSGNPAADAPFTAERFAALDHALVTVLDGGPGFIDGELARLGLSRRVMLRQPHFYAALAVAARTDLVVSLPESLADRLGTHFDLVRRPTPIAKPDFTMALIWPALLDRDPSHTWLRGEVRAVAALIGLR